VPIWVAIGILVSIGVYQTLDGKIFDGEILNAPNLMSETIQHVYISGISFALVAVIGVPVGLLIAQAGSAVRVPVFLLANLGQARCAAHGDRPGGLRVASRAPQHSGRYPECRSVGGRRGPRNGHDALASIDACAVATCIAIGICRPANVPSAYHRNSNTWKLHWRRRSGRRYRGGDQQQ
jgi:hypothetical protein